MASVPVASQQCQSNQGPDWCLTTTKKDGNGRIGKALVLALTGGKGAYDRV